MRRRRTGHSTGSIRGVALTTEAAGWTLSNDRAARREPLTLPEILAMKPAGTKIVMVTAYDHPSARLASEAGVDLILVGDSAGNNVLGYVTVPVTMDEAVMLTAAVARARPRALVVGDMPFGSFQPSDAQRCATPCAS